ncbi:MAG: AAA family ATPase [Vicinamibacterales bacterium]
MITEDQRAVLDCLSRPDTYGPGCGRVDRIDTHSAVVFLAGDRAYKLKRAVRYDYLDFSTVERRKRFVEAEFALNRRTAPALYRRVVPLTRGEDGVLTLDGQGTPVEWLLEMTRFDGEALCDRLAERQALPLSAMPRLAHAVADMHAGADVRPEFGGAAGMRWVVDGNAQAFEAAGDGVFPVDGRRRLAAAVERALRSTAGALDARRERGLVRQCHGDLHLRNLVMLDGVPTPFDAVEFNDDIACTDVFYDLAFLLMDLWRRGLPRHANLLLNEYVRLTGDVDGLAALPLFLSCRAAVRAKTSATAAAVVGGASAGALRDTAREYLAMAVEFLAPPPPVLVAIGGLSGAGKSVTAAALAPTLGPAPGALHLRSDVERKALLGVDPLATLGEDAYSADMSGRVYERLLGLARGGLAAGHGVICDAVYADAARRTALSRVADEAGVPLVGLWLDAPPEVLVARVAARRDDASDATPEVVRRQVAAGVAPGDWTRVDASGDAGTTLDRVTAALDRRRVPHR